MSAVYTSTVVGRGHVLAGAACGLALGSFLHPWPLAVLLAGATTVLGVHLGTVRLAVGPDDVRVTAGRWGRARRVPRAAVVAATPTELDRLQVLGVGLPWRRRTTRLTVRPGPTLVLELTDGELVRISTADPLLAAAMAAPIPEVLR